MTVAVSVREKLPLYIIISCILITGFYFSSSSFLEFLQKNKEATDVYPGNTIAWSKQLIQTDDIGEMEKIADIILKLNPEFSLANAAKARVAYAEGDFAAMIAYKEKAIDAAKYSLEEYLDYFDMLAVGVSLYSQSGETRSAEYCLQKLQEIPTMLSTVKDGTSSLGWRIQDLPQLDLPEEYHKYLDTINSK